MDDDIKIFTRNHISCSSNSQSRPLAECCISGTLQSFRAYSQQHQRLPILAPEPIKSNICFDRPRYIYVPSSSVHTMTQS